MCLWAAFIAALVICSASFAARAATAAASRATKDASPNGSLSGSKNRSGSLRARRLFFGGDGGFLSAVVLNH